MIIKKIHINGFGKLALRDYEFCDGINLIQGGNEAGKSTLHKFIEAMFFGFFKSYSKNKTYSAEYEKFSPWEGSSYSGSISYIYEGRPYTLYRNFYKQNEMIILTDDTSGEDSTYKLGYDPVNKLPRAFTHLGVNKTIFENTVSISQLNSITKQDLAKETGELMMNISQTNSSEVNFTIALEALTQQKNELGTKRQSRSRMGIAVSNIQKLEDEYAQTTKALEESRQHLKKAKELMDEADRLKIRREMLKKRRSAFDEKALWERWDKYSKAKAEAQALTKSLNKGYSLTEEEFERYSSCSLMLEEVKNQLESLNADKAKAEANLEKCKNQREKLSGALNAGVDTVKADGLIYSGIVSQMKKIKKYKADEKLAQTKAKIDDLQKKGKIALILTACLLSAALVVGAISLFTSHKLYLYSAVLLGSLAIPLGCYLYFARKSKKFKAAYGKYDTVIEKSVSYEIKLRAQLDALKEKYAVDDYTKLREIFSKADSLSEEDRKLAYYINKLEVALEAYAKREKELNSKAEHYEIVMGSILKQSGAKDDEELREMLNLLRSKNEAALHLKALEESMADSLGEFSEDELSQRAQLFALQKINLEEGLNKEETESKLNSITQEIYEISTKSSELKGRALEAEASLRSPGEILEQKQVWEEELEECEFLSDAIDLAYNTIVRISTEIQGSFAGVFNDYISQVVFKLTDGKYSDIKADDKMNISVKDEGSGKTVNVMQLSGGAVDQIYFAVRYAVAELMLKDKTVPMFLDDCFVQYDAQRLKNALKFLGQEADKRQIFMFCCREDEKNILDEIGIKYKEIKL